MQNRAVVTMEACKSSIEAAAVLNDLTAQFVDLSSRVFEIEGELEEIRKVLLDLIGKM